MALIKCKMCGGDMEITSDKTYGICEFCGSTMTLPRLDDDQRAARFNRGNHFRRIGEFDKALSVYEQIVQEDDTDAETHWCCALSRFGIEYVEDPATLVDNSRSQGYFDWYTNGGNNTQDKIFLLSYAEAHKYLNATRSDSSNTKSRTSPTAYAKVHGAHVSDSSKTSDGTAAAWWWLRSPGGSQDRTALVDCHGFIDQFFIYNSSACVRPALWIDLEADIY